MITMTVTGSSRNVCIFPLLNYGKLFQIVWLVKGVHNYVLELSWHEQFGDKEKKLMENFLSSLSSVPIIHLATKQVIPRSSAK